MKTRTNSSSYLLVTISITLGIISIGPLLVLILGIIIGNVFNLDLQQMGDFMAWLGSTRLVVYIGWLSVPGLVFGFMASIKATSRSGRWLGIVGVFLGLLGILWTYFISGMLRLASFL